MLRGLLKRVERVSGKRMKRRRKKLSMKSHKKQFTVKVKGVRRRSRKKSP